ncbi:MAG: Maf family protein [Myxococcota bacterium]|jgi:septum formation protein|nr:Maf family protein [Myxococcota bacterium]
MHDLVLGSTSPYRRELLARLRVPFDVLGPDVDEEALQRSGAEPSSIALRLAVAKAASVAAKRSDAFVIGSDQVVDLDSEILGKPGDEARAREQLARLQGRTHRLVTAVALRAPDGTLRTHVDVHRMTLRSLGAAEIERYVAAEQPLDCCGAYKIESLGIALFERIEGDDFTAIPGLPLIALGRLLRESGFEVP